MEPKQKKPVLSTGSNGCRLLLILLAGLQPKSNLLNVAKSGPVASVMLGIGGASLVACRARCNRCGKKSEDSYGKKPFHIRGF